MGIISEFKAEFVCLIDQKGDSNYPNNIQPFSSKNDVFRNRIEIVRLVLQN